MALGRGRWPVSQNNDPNSAAQNILTGKSSKLMFSIKKPVFILCQNENSDDNHCRILFCSIALADTLILFRAKVESVIP